jgi:iron complex transport system substrate-binding protein
MKKTIYAIIILMMCLAGSIAAPRTRQITDMAGRKVMVPVEIKKIFSVNPNGTIFVYTFNPELLAGWNYRMPEKARPFIPDRYFNLKNYGQLFGREAGASLEEIKALAPDIVLYMFPHDRNTLARIGELQAKLDIPFVVISPELENIAGAYRFMGTLTGDEKRGLRLAELSKAVTDRAAAIAARKENYPSFYYGVSDRGQSTITGDSSYTEVFRLCGLSQVYRGGSGGGMGRVQVNMEELAGLNPQYIILGGEGDGRGRNSTGWIYNDDSWRIMTAVRNRNVFAVPDSPFNWLDKPPSVNRLAGIIWLLWVFHPAQMNEGQFKKEIVSFYREFYHVNASVNVAGHQVEIKSLGFVKGF